MTFPTIGDLAQSYSLRRQSAQMQIALARSAEEIATGRLANPAPELGSAMQDFSGIERRLSTIPAQLSTAREVIFEAESAQAAFETLSRTGENLAASLIGPASLTGPASLDLVAQDAEDALATIISALNTRVGDRTLFGGTAVDRAAMVPADTLLDAVEAELALAGAVTLDDLVTTVDAYFAPGGAFETTSYTGSPDSRIALHLTESQRVDPLPRADDEDLREFLASATKAALIARDPLGLSGQDKVELAQTAGTGFLSAADGLAAIRARIGQTERRSDLAIIELQSEEQALQLARNDLIGVDPFTAATELADAEARLEKIYTITARLSRLTLTDFIR